jgi:radical S-adenosyl methionine domain-containing protein 2
MRCKFCFATYDSILPVGFTNGLPLIQGKLLIGALSLSGFRKLTFAGGEPTLCPWLTEIVAHAKCLGFKTALVSNGSRLTDELIDALSPHLDWIALSIDSGSGHVNIAQGRAVGGGGPWRWIRSWLWPSDSGGVVSG